MIENYIHYVFAFEFNHVGFIISEDSLLIKFLILNIQVTWILDKIYLTPL